MTHAKAMQLIILITDCCVCKQSGHFASDCPYERWVRGTEHGKRSRIRWIEANIASGPLTGKPLFHCVKSYAHVQSRYAIIAVSRVISGISALSRGS